MKKEIPLNQPVAIGTPLENALSYLKVQSQIPDSFVASNTTIVDYIGSVNWIMKTFAPDIPFAWEDNVWAGDPRAHNWIHQSKSDPTAVQTHADSEVVYLNTMVFNPKYKAYWPDFIVFDKWERDVFDSALLGDGVNHGYLYNTDDWNIYMQYVTAVSKGLNNEPVMLWQIPGSHLQTVGDVDNRQDHGSADADYFLGDPNLDPKLANVDSYIFNWTIDASALPYYAITDNSVVDYLNQNAQWQAGHMQAVEHANVFAILWGGGNTTGVIDAMDAKSNGPLNDNGWLYSRLSSLSLVP